ncbi:MAG: sulfatase-like hydrolase/transferase, partial [Armatimonadetes bacterium]|nr:sulfatase-like hydrolase/transferase [Armatimonadota bacterium]
MPPNLICIVSDTLRTAYLGCYGNPDIHTPNLDAFARQSVVFDRAYPESLPTIPVRRALHTGRRAYPFAGYQPIPWDIVYLPGWQPMDPAEKTLAEDLAGAGYHTGFVTDTLPYFQPGMNFARGFWQWEYIRGLQQDRWQSPATPTDEELACYGDPAEIRCPRQKSTVLRHVANTREMRRAGETTTDRMYRWAEQFVRDNRSYGPFYLLVDGFAPHEPWDAPDQYLRLYADPDYPEPTIVH